MSPPLESLELGSPCPTVALSSRLESIDEPGSGSRVDGLAKYLEPGELERCIERRRNGGSGLGIFSGAATSIFSVERAELARR
jgi:hypothetical protein